MKIQNSVAFVTGANRGLGLALVQELVARGAKTVYAGMREPRDLGLPGVVSVKLDVTDAASVAAAAAQCQDVTLLVNNAGIARVMGSAIEPGAIEMAREIMETNYYGVIRTTQAFAPIVAAKPGGAVVNVLSDSTWLTRPLLAAYSATKAAAWSFTNALRIELREKGTEVLGLHVGFMDTDMTNGFDMTKVSARDVAAQTLGALEAGKPEVFADQGTRELKQSLSLEASQYLNPPDIS